MPSLFDPLAIGDLTLRNRVVMAPMTRARAGADRAPGPLVAQYYAQRATAGLIISEAVSVTSQGVGYAGTPGIWSDEQVEGWKLTTDAVHETGGLIFLQLWHVGRLSDPSFLDGNPPVSASPVAAKGNVHLLRPARPYPVPRGLSIEEIAGVVEAFRRGSENAMRAGFDGVEVHGGNGYLLDQFLQDSTNLRDDAYGGSIENRARLMVEAVDAAVSVFGAKRVGLHISPRGDAADMGDSDPLATFGHVARAMRERDIGFICAREHLDAVRIGPQLKAEFGGIYIANERLDGASAAQLIESGEADAVAFGKLFIANPDLPQRIASGAPLNTWDVETFYTDGPEGYVDYAMSETEWRGAQEHRAGGMRRVRRHRRNFGS